MKNLVACVVLPIALEKEFDYSVPGGMTVAAGMRVLVNFNGAPKLGVIVGVKQSSQIHNLKPLLKVLDKKPLFTQEHFEFVEALTRSYPYSSGEFLYMMLPKFLKKTAVETDCALAVNNQQTDASLLFVKADTFQERYRIWKTHVVAALERGSVLICFPQRDFLASAQAVLQNDFPHAIRILHGYQKESEMARQWQLSRSKSIILGTRVAFWYYPSDLSLLIVEEENSPYYFQEEKPYHRISDVVLALSKIKKNKVIFAANYPTVNTYKLIEQNKIILHEAKEAESTTASVKLLDVAEHFKSGLLSPLIIELLRRNIDKGKRSVLILNKKGYGYSLSCSVCGYILHCQRCSSFLKLDHARNEVFCSYCAERTPFKQNCPRCKGGLLKSSGTGLEKLLINLKRIFPGVKIDEYGLESADTKVVLATSKILSSLYDMHSFDVGFVLDADTCLAREDYDAGIKTFIYLKTLALFFKETLYVITRNIGHSFYRALSDDWVSFYAHELKERKAMQLPPFYGLARIEVRGVKEDLLYKKATHLYNNLRSQGLDVYGPFQSQPFKQRDKFHLYLLVKAKQAARLRKLLKEAIKVFREKTVKAAVIIE